MGNAARKARKRSGEKFTKAQKKATTRYIPRRERSSQGFGMVGIEEMLAVAQLVKGVWR